ncbi:hypothetical protein CQA57_07330 [Helicobacter anseris]|uniref:DUF4435 domain-containing protein n=1 Tax=Helicobacter anseris TaxID=375926 RepID=A0A3D8J3K6_9HELI|nr:DUF3226 domain-containing protein [Helicobacter anseris]RDU72003.1 hypothetical protein CQA57_07330 [Helicobacter anseris]
MNIKIFVEGKHDKEFLEVYLKYLGILNTEIMVCNGNTIDINIHSNIQEAKDKQQKVFVVFDCDKSYEETFKRLIDESRGLLCRDEIFLFPNNSQSGELETLLFTIAKEPQIYECFKRYKDCIALHNPSYAKNIQKKSARFAYFEALGLLGEKKDEERKKAYVNIFDFDSAYLDSLRSFLLQKLSNA